MTRPARPLGGAAGLLAGLLAAAPAAARIVLVQTPTGPVWTNVPEPAGTKLPKPGPQRLPYRQLIDQCAARHGVDARLVEAVIACESNFDPGAVSSAGAQGLMQLMPATATQYGLADPFDAEKNVDAGTRHLGDLIKRFGGDWRLVAAAYNAGAGAVERSGGVPPYPETMHYVRKVHHYLNELGADASGGRPDGVSIAGDAGEPAAPDPVLDWQPEPEPAPEPEPEPEPPRRAGPRPSIVRDAAGRAVFTNRPDVKAAGGRRR